MITNIEIEGFKSLQKVSLKLGGLNLFVGTNASGKSNLFDALRVLQGIGYGFTIDEIFNGKPKSANSEVWAPIRGGSSKADFIGKRMAPSGSKGEEIIRFSVSLAHSGKLGPNIDYSIGLSALRGCVRSERLAAGGTDIFSSESIKNHPDSPFFEVRYYGGKRGRQPQPQYEKSRPVLHQLLRDSACRKEHAEVLQACTLALSNTQRIDPFPTLLREYSQAQLVKRMGERGENFAALVKAILADEKAQSAYLSWLQHTPTEVDDVEMLEGALGEPLFALREKGTVYPAPILSDGTLRFAAITAAFFQPDMPDILTIEEIENGIHPSRLRLLVELLKSQSRASGRQVMATTHSPIVLAWLKEDDYPTTFFCKRDEETGASVITPLSQVPNFLQIVKKQPIGDLFAEAWLEGAL